MSNSKIIIDRRILHLLGYGMAKVSTKVGLANNKQVAINRVPRILSRYSDILHERPFVKKHLLPPVKWKAIGNSAPTLLKIDRREPTDPLPHADIVVLTWTTAEWQALDHVFLNGSTVGKFADDKEWLKNHVLSSDSTKDDKESVKKWLPYARGASPYMANSNPQNVWGYFQLVSITDRSGRPWRVLLFKSNTHLAHPPWGKGLSVMLRYIIDDAKPDRIYTIGTAGGARVDQCLGDVVIANSALLMLENPENTTDLDNRNIFRCPSWFPSTDLLKETDRLLFRMKKVVTKKLLKDLFKTLKSKHGKDYDLSGLDLSDLVNESISPQRLGSPKRPKLHPMKDTPILTTDFYYIAEGNDSTAYSALEMDDAIIAREANRARVRFAIVRNISDGAVPKMTRKNTVIPEAVRSDWSSLIYRNFGLYTSYNGALAAWATIAGEGIAGYEPKRGCKTQHDDPLEVKLVFEISSCGTCSFFWPKDKRKLPYGPFTSFDFDINVPLADRNNTSRPSDWVAAKTRPPSFPNGEIMDGCRKAPIMTVGINPNMTAFLPGQAGAAWCYPNFSSENDTDAWSKYAWYYRYRKVSQERLTIDFVKKFILPEGRIVAPRSGQIVSAIRKNPSPSWTFTVRYDGDCTDTEINLKGEEGDFPYVLLFDTSAPNNVFAAGDIIAGRLAVPKGIQVEIMQQQETYYTQFEPVLRQFEKDLQTYGFKNVSLEIGEDVCQLDMVACASPHWKKEYLGGTDMSVNKIVSNCVTKNGWAIKQIVQTRPAVLYIVSKEAWDMFSEAFGSFVQPKTLLLKHPEDGDFTLLRETTDLENPCYLVFKVRAAGLVYESKTRLVITPHFSYSKFFVQQFRMSQKDWKTLEKDSDFRSFIEELTKEKERFVTVMPKKEDHTTYVVIQLKAKDSLEWLKEKYPSVYEKLHPRYYYDPHHMMASVLNDMFVKGEISCQRRDDGTEYLGRTEGPCQFCVNRHWQFPNECRYGKASEEPLKPGYLEKVAAKIIAKGKKSGTARKAVGPD
ncbi:MAG: GTPase [Thaumarchaeota archaeon]|nr:GTPase [Nitrososphaerota archaeon]